jgi:hypothetical protein
VGAICCSACRAAFCAAILLLRAKVDSPKCYRYQCYLDDGLCWLNRIYPREKSG